MAFLYNDVIHKIKPELYFVKDVKIKQHMLILRYVICIQYLSSTTAHFKCENLSNYGATCSKQVVNPQN